MLTIQSSDFSCLRSGQVGDDTDTDGMPEGCSVTVLTEAGDTEDWVFAQGRHIVHSCSSMLEVCAYVIYVLNYSSISIFNNKRIDMYRCGRVFISIYKKTFVLVTLLDLGLRTIDPFSGGQSLP